MDIVKASVKLVSLSGYSPSRFHGTDKLPKESDDDYERRVWREKAHYDEKGVFIPPTAFKSCLWEAAKYLAEKIKGKGQKTWTEKFMAGVQVYDPCYLGVKLDELLPQWVHCHANGTRGSGKRVMRCFPYVPRWETTVEYEIYDLSITKEVFGKHLEQAGLFIGVGRFRPRNAGHNGRFRIAKLDWR